MELYNNITPVMLTDPSGEFIVTLCVCIGVGIGAGYAYSKAKDNGAEGWELVGWTLLGGVVGGAAGYFVGSALAGFSVSTFLAGGAKSVGGKLISDVLAHQLYGTSMGSWQSYLAVFAFGGLLSCTGFEGMTKFAYDVFGRPAVDQWVGLSVNGGSWSMQKYGQDVFNRAVTYGLRDDVKPFARGILKGLWC